MSEFTEYQYNMGCDLAIAVIADTGKMGAVSLLENLCSPIGNHCPVTQGLRDTAKDFINGGNIPAWMKYESLQSVA